MFHSYLNIPNEKLLIILCLQCYHETISLIHMVLK